MSTHDINSPIELIGATDALRDWFISQGIQPHDSIMIMEYFMAKMVIQNSAGPHADAAKIAIITKAITDMVQATRIIHP